MYTLETLDAPYATIRYLDCRPAEVNLVVEKTFAHPWESSALFGLHRIDSITPASKRGCAEKERISGRGGERGGGGSAE